MRETRRPPPRHVLLETARCAAADDLWPVAASIVGIDRVAEAAARAATVPMAAVTLVGADEVRFVGRHGIDQLTMPRSSSFCDRVVRAESSVLIEDAAELGSADQAGLSHEGVVRSYAGVPMADADGYVVGTVCVMAPAAGAVSAAVLDDLAALAALVETMLARGPAVPEGPPIQGYLGVKTASADAASDRAGLLVLRVARESPAERAGLAPGDILHSIDGVILRRPADVARALAARHEGWVVEVKIRRRGQWIVLHVPITRRASA